MDARSLAALALVGALGAACTSEAAEPFSGRVLSNPYPVADLALDSTQGGTYNLAEDSDKRLTLVFFGYSNCPDICQTVMGSLTTGMKRLTDEERDQIDLVFITTDPATDDVETLGDYLARFDPSGDIVGLTGDLDDIIAAGEPMGAYVDEGDPLPSGGYDLGGHTTAVYAVDGGDTAPVVWSDDTTPGQYAADLSQLLGDA